MTRIIARNSAPISTNRPAALKKATIRNSTECTGLRDENTSTPEDTASTAETQNMMAWTVLAVPRSVPECCPLRSPPPQAQSCPGKTLAATKGRNSPANLVLAGLVPAIHALAAVETRTWIRGSSPRKTTLTRFRGVPHKLSLQANFARTTLPQAEEG